MIVYWGRGKARAPSLPGTVPGQSSPASAEDLLRRSLIFCHFILLSFISFAVIFGIRLLLLKGRGVRRKAFSYSVLTLKKIPHLLEVISLNSLE